MNKLVRRLLPLPSLLAVLVLTGCALGQEEASCPGKPNGTLCMGPRQVMELTNSRDDLTDMMETKNEGKKVTDASDSRYPTEKNPPNNAFVPHPTANSAPLMKPTGVSAPVSRTIAPAVVSGTPVASNKPLFSGNAHSFNQPPNGKGMYSLNNGKPTNPTLTPEQIRQYQTQGFKEAVTAPEPLAMLQQGKVMRITFTPYTDDNDALNLPGYVYVNVKPQTWIAGDRAKSNPARIVPLQVQDAARENMTQQQRGANAVDAIGIQHTY